MTHPARQPETPPEETFAPLAHALTASAPPPGTPVLVAVSGGADSTALLRALVEAELDLELAVAHFDHRLRPDSTTDASRVLELCENLGVKSYLRRWKDADRSGGEAAAREARYTFLRELCRGEGFRRIVLGHTLEDQVETLIVNLTRGAGLDGLAGMVVDDGELWRPFLNLRHRRLRAYLRSRGVGWIEDPSNRDKSIARNLIRHQVLPLLAQVNPEVLHNIARASGILARQRDFLRRRGDELAAETYLATGPWGEVHGIQRLTEVHEALLFEALRAVWAAVVGWRGHLTSAHLVEMADLVRGANEQAAVDLPKSLRLRRSWHKICLGPKRLPKPPAPLELDDPGRWEWGSYLVELSNKPMTGSLGHLSVETADLPLTLRSRIDGDALRLSGVGTKKLKKILSESRVPAWEREHVPVIADAAGPLWVPGLARDERARETGALTLSVVDQTTGPPPLETEPEGPEGRY
jgi:tRNA(Ile)-lysidine synthase